MVGDYQIKGDMSWFGSFWVKTAENNCKNCTVLCGSLKGDLWPKLTHGRSKGSLDRSKLVLRVKTGPKGQNWSWEVKFGCLSTILFKNAKLGF